MGAKLSKKEPFWAKVDMSGGAGACWYGTSANMAHRYSWFLHYGPVEQGMFIIHNCGNRSCVNPGHLELSMKSRKKTDPAVRFWAKVDGAGPAECWVWTAACTEKGYGIFHSGEQVVVAHCWSREFAYGASPEGLVIDHLCRVHHCMNPKHLEPVTRAVNTKRAVPFGVYGSANRRKTHCPQGHPYSDENTYVSKAGSRHCRACTRERLRGYREDSRKSKDLMKTEVAAA